MAIYAAFICQTTHTKNNYYYLSNTYRGTKQVNGTANVIFPYIRLQVESVFQSFGKPYALVHSHPNPGDGYHNDFPSGVDMSLLGFWGFGLQEIYVVPYLRCQNIHEIIRTTHESDWGHK